MAKKTETLSSLGKPNLAFSRFKVWVLSRQFPDLDDYWDGNWLNVIVHCSSLDSDVLAQGAIIHSPELKRWLEELKTLRQTGQGEAHLDCMEPYLDALVALNKGGKGELVVKLTPNHLIEYHKFTYEIDYSYLNGAIKELEVILREYPIKGTSL